MREGGGRFRLVASLHGGEQSSSAPIIPGEPNLPSVPPLGVWRIWFGFLFYKPPAQGRLTIVGGLQTPLLRGRILPIPVDGITAHP